MSYKAALLALVLVSSALAGCTGDPDAGGNDEIDLVLVQEFLNNTSLTMPDTLHSMSGVAEGEGSVDVRDNSSVNNCISYFGASDDWWDYCNVFSFEIPQPEGFAVSINYIVAYLYLIGTDSNGETPQHKIQEQQPQHQWQ